MIGILSSKKHSPGGDWSSLLAGPAAKVSISSPDVLTPAAQDIEHVQLSTSTLKCQIKDHHTTLCQDYTMKCVLKGNHRVSKGREGGLGYKCFSDH